MATRYRIVAAAKLVYKKGNHNTNSTRHTCVDLITGILLENGIDYQTKIRCQYLPTYLDFMERPEPFEGELKPWF